MLTLLYMHKYYDIYTNRTLNSLFTFKIFNYYLDIRYYKYNTMNPHSTRKELLQQYTKLYRLQNAISYLQIGLSRLLGNLNHP